jgi:hypothetical protein
MFRNASCLSYISSAKVVYLNDDKDSSLTSIFLILADIKKCLKRIGGCMTAYTPRERYILDLSSCGVNPKTKISNTLTKTIPLTHLIIKTNKNIVNVSLTNLRNIYFCNIKYFGKNKRN